MIYLLEKMAQGLVSDRDINIDDFVKPDEYKKCFNEVENLGKGKHGTVIKVQSKFHGQLSAVKIIPIREDRNIRKILSEVKVCAALNHSNIVGFKSFWLERSKGSEVPNNM
jgi:serine/threonine protein kinase